jgi:hypothetical protein
MGACPASRTGIVGIRLPCVVGTRLRKYIGSTRQDSVAVLRCKEIFYKMHLLAVAAAGASPPRVYGQPARSAQQIAGS